MSALERFLDRTGDAFGVREYSTQRIINKLEGEIQILHQWLLNNEPGSDTWKEKRKAMMRKIDNLNTIKEENNV